MRGHGRVRCTDRGVRTQVGRTLAGALLALGVAGCSGQGVVVQAGEVSVLVAERPDAGMDALGGGRVEVVGGCLGAGGSVIVWPHGTRVVDQEPLRVEVPGYGTFGLGDEVELGGGYVREHSSGAVEPGPYEVAGVTVPATCAEHDVFLAR